LSAIFLRSRSTLERLPSASERLPPDFCWDKAGAALHASADGKFLYVSNRGTANQLVVFGIDPATGQLKELQKRSVEGDHPREFALDPSGKFVLIANQKSNQIVVVERDAKTGLLGKTVQKLPIDAPSDLKFLVRQ